MDKSSMIKFDFKKKYEFPTDLSVKYYGGFLLLISPSNGNWIVLENQNQVEITKAFINGNTAEEIITQYGKNYENDIKTVLTELHGKHFCEKMKIQENEFTLRIYLTNKCNLRCKHCFMYAAHELKNELTFEEIINLLNKSKNGGCSKVIFTGGEITLKKRFMEILKHAHTLGLYVQVLSNGISWNEDMIKEASLYIDEIQISIDGFNEETNAAIRGIGAFEKSLLTAERFLKEKNPFVSIITTPTYDFIEKYKDEYIQFGKELVDRFGTERFLIIFGKELLDGRSIKSDTVKNQTMTQIVDEIYEQIYPNSELTTFVANHKHNKIFMSCGYGGLTINSNGEFFFCGRVQEVRSYGNIRNISFEDILKKRKIARQKSYVDHIIPCKDCDIRYICGGGCRIAHVPGIINANLDNGSDVFSRKCEETYKNNIYRLMIEANEYLYW